MIFFFFNDPATTEIYTLSLHDALPISRRTVRRMRDHSRGLVDKPAGMVTDRKSTRLNSSHANISYAVFCLKKKNKTKHEAGVRISSSDRCRATKVQSSADHLANLTYIY